MVRQSAVKNSVSSLSVPVPAAPHEVVTAADSGLRELPTPNDVDALLQRYAGNSAAVSPETVRKHPLAQALSNREHSLEDVEQLFADSQDLTPAPLEKGSRTDYSKDVPDIPTPATAEQNDAYAFSAARCFGDVDVPYTSVAERPWHKSLAYFAAQGLNAKQQCMKLGGQFDQQTGQYIPGTGMKAYGTICNVNRQPWFKNRIIEAISEIGRDQLTGLLETQMLPSLETLIRIRDNEKASPSVRASCANSLLDRFLGKATQPYTGRSDKQVDPEDEVKSLQAELARLSDASA